MQNVNTYICEGCRYFYADWEREKYYCLKEKTRIEKPCNNCPVWDDTDIDDEWIQHLEQEAIGALYLCIGE